MDDTNAASEAGRALIAHRWGSQKVERAAELLIDRVDELPPVTRARLHLATADQEDVTDDV